MTAAGRRFRRARAGRGRWRLALCGLLLLAAFAPGCDGAGDGPPAVDAGPPAGADVTDTAGDPARGPRIVVTPERLRFTDLRRGEAQTAEITVVNGGTAPLVVDRFTLSAAPQFTVTVDGVAYVSNEDTRAGITLDPPIALPPDASITIPVAYLSETGEARDGTLQLHSNDAADAWAVVYLEAAQPGPRIAVAPTRLSFGARIVGETATLPLRIVSRGTAPLTVTSVAFADGSDRAFRVWTEGVTADGAPLSPENPLVVAPNDAVSVPVEYAPEAPSRVDVGTGRPVLDTATLVVRSDAFEDPVEVTVDGHGTGHACPTAVIAVEEGHEVVPQTNLHLVGDQSYATAGQVRKWEWQVDQPAGSQSVFVPAPTFPNPTFEVNVAGTYTFRLDVWDDENVKSCEPATWEVVVIPDEAIHVELLWSTPNDPDESDTGPFAGANVDLHFVHPDAPTDPTAPDVDGDGAPDPYFDDHYDCYWANPHPDWGAQGEAFDDDPGLDRDDTDGAGPENVNLNIPENGTTYEVAVHYRDDHGYGASSVTVRVYIYQILVFELSNVRLVADDLWCVAFVDWPSGSVDLCEAEGGGYRITPDYRHRTPGEAPR